MISIASAPHYAAHLDPITRLLPADLDVTVVASYRDLLTARKRGAERIVLAQHGAGQSYGGDPTSARHPSYPGGDDNDDVGLFLVPNEHAAKRWRDRYPRACVRVIGSPRLDTLPARDGGGGGAATVAVSFHFDPHVSPEARSAFGWYRSAVAMLADRFHVIGHGHPKATHLPRFYERNGIEHVASFDDVCRRADIYVCDNSSTLFEFASTGRPVVVMNAPWYRRDIDHGLRFWDTAEIGANIWHPGDLIPAVENAKATYGRLSLLDEVYAHPNGAAARAAEAIIDFAS